MLRITTGGKATESNDWEDLNQPHYLHGHERKHIRFLYPKGLKTQDLPDDEVEAVTRLIRETESRLLGTRLSEVIG